MTPEAQRSAIAIELGWEKIDGLNCSLYHFRCWRPPGIPREEFWRFCVNPPNYPNDLNAMAEAENVLNEDQSAKYYCTHLPDVTGADTDGWMFKELPKISSATAAQRAEAFLRAIGKWTNQ